MPTRSPILRPARALVLLLIVALLGVAPAPALATPAASATSPRSSTPAAPPPGRPRPTAQDSGIHPTDAITPTVSAGGSHTCGLRSDGQVLCWGYDGDGQVSGVPGALFTNISVGGSHSCGIQSDGAVSCWGRNVEGQVAPVPSGTFKDISAGGSHSCGVKTDGTLACWGDNSDGQAPTPAPGGLFTQVSAGGSHTCGLKTDGSAVCWGDNSLGQAPMSVPGGPFKEISTGFLHSCGLKTDSTVVCWGGNSDGQAPALVLLGDSFKEVSAGGLHSCGLKADNTVVCWGSNSDGQAPTGAPTGVFSQASAGNLHSCGVKSGDFYCWGKNDQGQAVNHIAPRITLEPTDKTTAAKNMLILSAAASGSPTPSISWYRDDTLISSATNVTTTAYIVDSASSLDSGIYYVIASNDMGAVSSNRAVVTVNRLSQALGFAPLPNGRLYGTPPIELMATASSLLPVSFQIASGPATIEGRFLKVTGAGKIAVRVEQPGNEFYTAAPPLTQTLSIQPAPLTIRADNKAILFGTRIPTLTLSYIGLVNGDTPDDLDQPPSIKTLGALGSPLGNYPIVVNGGADPNYQITRVNGVLRIVQYQVHFPIVFP